MNSFQFANLCSASAILIVLFSVVNGGLVEVNDCENGLPKPKKVYVSNCDEQPCNFVQGTTVEMNMTFMIQEDYKTIYAGADAKVMGIIVPYPLPQPNACESLLNNRCPLENEEIVTYQLFMPILKAFPPITLEVIFQMHEDIWNRKPFLCFIIAANIVVP